MSEEQSERLCVGPGTPWGGVPILVLAVAQPPQLLTARTGPQCLEAGLMASTPTAPCLEVAWG